MAAIQEDTTRTGSAADNMIRLLNVEIIRKDDYTYKQWKKDPQLCRQPLISTSTIDDSTPEVIQERFDISHLSVHLAAWEKQLPTTIQPFFSFADVKVMTENSASKAHVRVRDGRAHLELRVFCQDMALKKW
jgi:hypothetical protein